MRRLALTTLLLLAACDDEAMMHPPIPPSTAIPELGAASQPASQPASTAAAAPSSAGAPQMTMQQFMTDDVEPAARKALLSKKSDPVLDHWLKILATTAPDDPRFTASPTKSWAAVTENSMRPGRYAQGCRQCHAMYLRPYKKKYHDLTFPVPAPE